MVDFIPKKISSEESLGEELRRARQAKNLSTIEVAKSLQISQEYLLALEMEDFNLLPSGLYGKNYLKKYADFLGIPKDKTDIFLSQLESKFDEEDPFSQKVVSKSKLLIFPKIIKNILISLAILVCFLYLTLYFKNIIVAPDLEIYTPAQNMMINESAIEVTGQTEAGAEVSINDEAVLANKDGYFSKLINLKKGLNTLEISAKKKYSKEIIITRQILVE